MRTTNRTWFNERLITNQAGKCARKSACTNPHDNRTHPHSLLKYCNCCADAIEHMCSDVGLKLPVRK